MNAINRKQIDAGTMFTGIMMIAVGVLFLLDRMHVASFHYVARHWWPMIIVGLGVSKLLRHRVWAGLWMIAIGAWLQIVSLRLFDQTFSNSWPLLLIVFGAGMILRAILEGARRGEPATPEERRGE